MASIRKTKTGSGATAVQIVKYVNRKVVVLKHVGSARSPDEIDALVESAEVWISQEIPQISLFQKIPQRVISLATSQYTGITYTFAYDVLTAISRRTGFGSINNQLLLDLAFMRLIEPASKLRSIVLMEKYFHIKYAERSVYRILPKLKNCKVDVERIAVACAKEYLRSDLALVLYDVTTLYFETFDVDDLRKPGFSKDSKSQQPQIMIGLLVTSEGFPLGYEVFLGNTFEGHMMIPVLEKFAAANNVELPIVVADAAMISRENVAELELRKLSYIVGARMANCKPKIIKESSVALNQKDGATVRIPTDHGDLICTFSAKRFRKDKAEMEKQIAKGKSLIAKREPGKRAKFVKHASEGNIYVLDDALVTKTKLLLGVKGYYTNIPQSKLSNDEIITRYRDLWHVEQAFRIAKSDLAARPIFHHKQDAVHAHMVICFVALALGKYLEIAAKLSLRRITDILLSVTDAEIIDTITGEQFTMRSEPDDEVRSLMQKLKLVSY
ncbi:IS1634 family transposase [Candidatus Peregrinibacteria bacterium]|nr:IS1634 family transposase [Candidatus Peregrinibacteria bacterium]